MKGEDKEEEENMEHDTFTGWSEWELEMAINTSPTLDISPAEDLIYKSFIVEKKPASQDTTLPLTDSQRDFADIQECSNHTLSAASFRGAARGSERQADRGACRLR